MAPVSQSSRGESRPLKSTNRISNAVWALAWNPQMLFTLAKKGLTSDLSAEVHPLSRAPSLWAIEGVSLCLFTLKQQLFCSGCHFSWPTTDCQKQIPPDRMSMSQQKSVNGLEKVRIDRWWWENQANNEGRERRTKLSALESRIKIWYYIVCKYWSGHHYGFR